MTIVKHSLRAADVLRMLGFAWCSVLLALTAGQASAQDIRVAAHGTMAMEDERDVAALAFSANGNTLLSGDVKGRIQCWDLARKVTTVSSQMENAILFLGFLANDQSFVAVDDRGIVAIFDLLKGAPGKSFTTRGTPARVALDAGKRYLAVATQDEEIELFDLKAEVAAGTIKAADKLEDVLFLGFDRLGQQIVAVLPYGDVHTWNPSTLKALRSVVLAGGELHGSRAVVHAAATNRATNVFAVSLEEVALPKGGIQSGRDLERRSMLIAYDWSSGAEIKRVKIPSTVERMAMGPGNDHLAVSGDDDNTITLIDLRKGEQGSVVTMTETPRVIAVSDDNRWLAGGGSNGVVAVWSLQFKGEASVAASSVPSLSGRIRARGSTQPALKEGEPVKMAILAFEGKGVPAEVPDITLSSVSNALANFDYITLVERNQIEKILKEQQFQLSGLTEEEGVSVGKILKADIVMLGSVGKLGSSLVFSARLISVETGKVLKGREVICEECRDQDIYDAINMLVSTIAR